MLCLDLLHDLLAFIAVLFVIPPATITSVYVFDPLHKSNTQVQEHHELSDICYNIAYSKQISEFEPVLALTVSAHFFHNEIFTSKTQ